MASFGNWAQIYTQNHARDAQKVLQSVQLHISHQMKPCSMVKTFRASSYTCFSVFAGIGASQGNLAQIHQIIGRDTQKIIQRVKPQISYQMKSCSRVKVIWGLSSTCFSVFLGIRANWGSWTQTPQVMGSNTWKIIQRAILHISPQMKPYSHEKTI